MSDTEKHPVEGLVEVGSHARAQDLGLVEIPRGITPAEVEVRRGRTLNLGNMEFERVDISVRVPCIPTDAHVEAQTERALIWVGKTLARTCQRVLAEHGAMDTDNPFKS